VSQIKTDPYEISLSYGQLTRIQYILSRDAMVTITILSPTGAAVATVISNILQSAGQQSVAWNGIDTTDISGKKFTTSGDGPYTVLVQALNPVTGSSGLARAALLISN
jgi:flagellar hook assembly protein FlgD